MTGVLAPGAVATHAHTAHFPGSGPAGKTCASCIFLNKYEKCRKWRELMTASRGRAPAKWDRIDRATAACRYWEIKQ